MVLLDKEITVKNSLDSGKKFAYSGKGYTKAVSSLSVDRPNLQSLDYIKKSNAGYTGKNGVSFSGVPKIQLRKGYLGDWKNKIWIKHPDEVFGCITAAVSVVCFAFGGGGLVYDSYKKGSLSKSKNNPASGAVVQKRDTKPGFSGYSSHNRDVSTGVSALLQQLIKESGNTANSSLPMISEAINRRKQDYKTTNANVKEAPGEVGSGEGYGDIIPKTAIGKAALVSAKFAMGISGFAGALTGLATRVPLMVAGEAVGNMLAAPIINTFAGFGLMNIGMAALISGRSLEKNVNTILDPVKFAAKGPVGKIQYVAQNIWMGIKETGKSMGEVGKNFGRLLSFNKEKINKGTHFFKNEFFRLKPTIIQLEQNIHTNGKTVAKTGMISNPHFLQFGAGILAISGVVMVGEAILEKIGVIKKDKADKIREACFVGGKAGQISDNVALAKYGMEKMAKGAPILGVPVLLSGATALIGAPNVDKDYGKGIIWGALSFFFALLAIERGISWKKISKARKELEKAAKPMVEATTGFVKSFKLDTSHIKGLTGKGRKNIFYGLEANEPAWPEFLDIFGKFAEKRAEKARTNITIKAKNAKTALADSKNHILEGITNFKKYSDKILSDKHYDPDYTAKDLVKALGKLRTKKDKRVFSEEFIKYADEHLVMSDNHMTKDNVGDVIKANMYTDANKGGVNYTQQILDPILKAEKTPEWVKTAINDAAKSPKIAEMLKKT